MRAQRGVRAAASQGLITKRYHRRGRDCTATPSTDSTQDPPRFCSDFFGFHVHRCCCRTINTSNSDVAVTLTRVNLSIPTYLLCTGKHLGLTMLSNLKINESECQIGNFGPCRPRFCPLVTRMDKMSDYL